MGSGEAGKVLHFPAAAVRRGQHPRRQRRVTVMCVPCERKFRYLYQGTGAYRSICDKCVKGKR